MSKASPAKAPPAKKSALAAKVPAAKPAAKAVAAPARKPAARPVVKAAPRPAIKPAVKPAVKVKPVVKAAATKPVAKAAAKATAKVPVGPAAAAAPAEKPHKAKLVRDSFTMPELEYAVLGKVKKACLKAGFEVKKSELLRIGVALISQIDLATLKSVLASLPQLKTGRPRKA